MYARVNARTLAEHTSRQLLLKPVLYLRWQQWSCSPGLIYLRGGIMNSLWHLIFPSLLIWLSAGMCTVIHTALASGVAPHTFRSSVDSRFTASHPDDANCAWALQSPWSLHVVHYRLSQQSAQLPFYYLFLFFFSSQPSTATFLLWLYSILLLCYWHMAIPASHRWYVTTIGMPSFLFFSVHDAGKTRSVSQFVAQANARGNK